MGKSFISLHKYLIDQTNMLEINRHDISFVHSYLVTVSMHLVWNSLFLNHCLITSFFISSMYSGSVVFVSSNAAYTGVSSLYYWQ